MKARVYRPRAGQIVDPLLTSAVSRYGWPQTVSGTGTGNLAADHASFPAGSVVTQPAGTFGNQSLTLDKPMTFRAHASGTTLGNITIATGAGQIELADFTVGTVKIGEWFSGSAADTAPAYAHDITLRNLNGSWWGAQLVRTFTVIGGDWGPVVNYRCYLAPGNPWDGNDVPHDVLVTGGLYHDFSNPNPSSAHAEGILCYGANGVTIRGVSFLRNGGTGDIGLFFLGYDPYPWGVNDFPLLCNVRIENCQGSPYFTGTGQTTNPNMDAYLNCQISGTPPIPGFTMAGNNVWPKQNGGILYFARAVPGGTPRSVAAPAGWGR